MEDTLLKEAAVYGTKSYWLARGLAGAGVILLFVDALSVWSVRTDMLISAAVALVLFGAAIEQRRRKISD